MKTESKTSKKFWIDVIIIYSILLVIFILAYYYGIIEGTILITWTASTIAMFTILIFMSKIHLNKDNKDDYWKKGYILVGAVAGLFIAFFGYILIIILVIISGGPNLIYAEGSGEVWIALLIICPIIGGIIANYIGKRRGYKPIQFFWKLDRWLSNL